MWRSLTAWALLIGKVSLKRRAGVQILSLWLVSVACFLTGLGGSLTAFFWSKRGVYETKKTR